MKNIRTRRTIRKYNQQPVSDELLNQLLADASRTQTMGNLQLYSVIVTRDEEMKKRLAPFHFNQPMVMNAPVVLTVCADFRRTTDWCRCRNASPGYNNFLSYQNAATDALLYAQTFCNLAEEQGLGICFLGTTVYMPREIIGVLELPELVVPVATLTVGWPDEEPQLTDRLPLEAFVHHETYKAYDAERIDALYRSKEELPENKTFVQVNNKETLAQVFTDCRYTQNDNEKMSVTLAETLAQQGFINHPLFSTSAQILESRPDVLECDVVRFQNNREKWVAFVGLHEGQPYEIFTGLMDEDEGICLPKSVNKGRIIKQVGRDGHKRYDFQFENKRGYKTTVEGLSNKFDPEYWNYAKLISSVLRYKMPIEHVIKLVGSLELDSEQINSWKTGVVRALKRYLPYETPEDEA